MSEHQNQEPNAVSTGLACLALMSRFHGIAMDLDKVAHDLSLGHEELSTTQMILAARQVGLHAKKAKPSKERLSKQALPAIATDKSGGYFILGAFSEKEGAIKALVQHPFIRAPQEWTLEEFIEHWGGELLLITSRASLIGELAKFDFSWFIPAIVRYRKPLLEVLLVSVVLQLFALATPLFFQVVMDKVLLHNALNTLNVIVICLLAITIFESILSVLRTYVFTHTSSRIDVELGARIYKHLLNLPIAYFEARRIGDSVARVREIENIRQFLTGNTITLILDIAFSFVFIGVMFWYSTSLTWLVLASIPVYFVISFISTPILRAQLDKKFNHGAENQAYLVESIGGVGTIKSMALEPRWINKWEQLLAVYVKAALAVNKTGILAHQSIAFVSKLVTIGITWMGASLVLKGEMTVGQLVAFNMLASHVADPIVRLAQMWSDFQQVGISMARLGDILNTRTEIKSSGSNLPSIRGQINFQQVTFRYKSGAAEALRDLSLHINAGETVAIVGRSGSGKSTLTKLIQRLYTPEQGKILVDGFDLSLIDPTSLRRQIGVVLQENTLFNKTIRDNISVGDPAAPFENIVAAAQKSGADEFIRELPQGYDTMVGENGVGLSGGQRQRISIARALLTDPKILILDEATSALDYESEKIVQDNMEGIRKGRTVIIVAHRLSTIKKADRICVMDRGQIIEQGTHAELLTVPSGLYAHLYQMQRA